MTGEQGSQFVCSIGILAWLAPLGAKLTQLKQLGRSTGYFRGVPAQKMRVESTAPF